MAQKFRLLGIVLAVALAMTTILAACSDSKDNKESAAPSQSDPAATTKEPLKLKITLPTGGGKNDDSTVQKEWLKQMEAKMGRKLDIQFNYIPKAEYDQKVKLMLSTNDIPDIIQLPFLYDSKPLGAEGEFLDLSKYKDLMPNYMKRIDETYDGQFKVYNPDGTMYMSFLGAKPRLPADQGMVVTEVASYRYDLFQKHNIKIPETWDEFYDAAKKLKELYPDIYPVNARMAQHFKGVFNANYSSRDIYWNGKEYVYGPTEEGYKEALQFLNKLYSEKLLDPEFSIDTDDLTKQKALNGTNLMWTSNWFTTPGEYTRQSTDGKVFAVTLAPDNPKYGTAWQEVWEANTFDLNSWVTFAISGKTKEPEEVVKLLDLQYSDETIRTVTWGIEGTTYEIGADGEPHFVDAISNAKDPWAEGDKFGMRASSHYSPGLQMASDSKAFLDFAPNDYMVINGEYKEQPIETAFMDLSFPDNKYVPPYFRSPLVQLSTEESQAYATIKTPLDTYRDEMELKFIMGKEKFENWDKFQAQLRKTADIDKMLKIYNDAAKRYLDQKASAK